jgi:hypothetical protein
MYAYLLLPGYVQMPSLPRMTVVKIPKNAILSVKSSLIEHLVPQHHVGVGAQLSLSLVLYVEMYAAKIFIVDILPGG